MKMLIHPFSYSYKSHTIFPPGVQYCIKLTTKNDEYILVVTVGLDSVCYRSRNDIS